jgi:NADH:ubiquinone reductase (H+-translocating)
MTTTHKIVIIGGGAGGLELATQLGNSLGKSSKADITLVDQKLTHIWKPLLHEIAAGSLNVHQEEVNYFAHAAKHYYQFVLGRFVAVDRHNKIVSVQSEQWAKQAANGDSLTHTTTTLEYDTLILALGSTSNDFNTEGVKQYCHFLDNLEQAQKFQQDLLHVYLDAQHLPDARELNIAIIGAGATGVELAAELIHAKDSFYQYGLTKIDPTKVKISVIEAADRILPALNSKTSEHTQEQLEQLGIQVLTNHRVAKVDTDYVYFADGSKLSAELKVWAAGIKAPEVLNHFTEFEKDRLNRLHVFATLQTTIDPDIFAFGDCAHCQPVANEPPLAPRAQVASQQASFLVRAMKARVSSRPLPMFRFSEKGSLVSLSQHSAVGELLGKINIHGVVAKSMYVSLYRVHQANIHGYTHAGLLTAKDLVTKNIGPKIKLH